MNTLLDARSAICPKSLDDIIRSNRDRMRAYLTTEEELLTLRGPGPIQAVTGMITHWNFVTFFLTESKTANIHLTGYNAAEQSSWMTSIIVAIDGNAVVTHTGSLYILEGEKSEELDLEYICATLNSWGIGQKFDVPPFFF